MELELRGLFVVRGACERNRRLLWTFQTSARYALTFHVGKFVRCFDGKIFILTSRYSELHSGHNLF